MKNLLLLTILLYVSSLSFAQEQDSVTVDNEFRTIFGKKGEKTKVSGFGAFNLDFMSVDSKFGLMTGGEGAVLINQSFFIGFYGRVLTSSPAYNYIHYNKTLDKNIEADQRAIFGHGGLMIGYIFNPLKPIHFGFTTRFGIGSVSMFDEYSYDKYETNTEYYYSDMSSAYPIYVFHPQIDAEMNITSWFKFRLSVGYQFTSSESIKYDIKDDAGNLVEKELFNTSNLSTPSLSMGFVLGWFK